MAAVRGFTKTTKKCTIVYKWEAFYCGNPVAVNSVRSIEMIVCDITGDGSWITDFGAEAFSMHVYILMGSQ